MKPLWSLGVMTGTSCDGADLALLSINGTRERLERVAARAFPPALQRRLREAQKGRLDIPTAAVLTRDYSLWIGSLCRSSLKRWKTPLGVTMIAVHGQTVWHAPEDRVTVQLNDPAVISAMTGCTVAAAFRQPDLARGGEGAPLVSLYHWIRAVDGPLSACLPFAIHNVGGIANLTALDRRREKVFAFDTGPGNCLIDLAVERATGRAGAFDRDGRMGASAESRIDWAAVERLGKEAYYRRKPPKSTGRELFNEAYLRKLPGSGATLVANATALAAHTMATAYRDFVVGRAPALKTVFVAGGGARNPTLMRLFRHELARLAGPGFDVGALPERFAPAQSLEAMSFARLGVEALQGRPVSLSVVTGAREDAVGAGIFPGSNFKSLLQALKKR